MNEFLKLQGIALEKLRKHYKLTQFEMSEIIDVSERQYQKYVHNQVIMPIERYIYICRYFHICFCMTDEFVDFSV